MGRGSELALLREALNATGSEAILAIVTGKAGVGKSRLVGEAIRPLVDAGAWVIRGECIASGRELIPLAPVLEGLRALIARVPDPANRRKLVALVSGEGRVGRSGDWSEGLTTSVLDAMIRAADGRRLILVIDDLQWADPATLGLVEHIGRNMAGARVTALTTLRLDLDTPPSVVRSAGELARRRGVHLIDLPPLDPDSVREMVAAAWGDGVADDVIERIVERSGGLPFYVESILADGDRSARALPHDLRLITDGQIAALPGDAQRLLEVMALVAEPAPASLLAASSGVREGRAESASQQLLDADLAVTDGGRWTVRHAIIGEVALSRLSDEDERRIHAAIAGPLRAAASAEPDRAAELMAMAARHADAAGDGRAALLDHLASARAALAAGLADLGSEQSMAALRSARRRPGDLDGTSWDRVDIDLLAAQALSLAGRASEALSVLESVSKLPADDGEAIVKVANLRGVILGQLGDVSQAGDITEAALAATAELPLRPELRCRLLNILASCRSLEGRVGEAHEVAQRALAIATDIDDPDALAESLSNVGMTLASIGDEVGAERRFDAAWDLVREAGALVPERGEDPVSGSRVYALVNIVDFKDAAGDHQAAIEMVDSLTRMLGCDEVRTRECRLFDSSAVMALYRLGRWAEAVARLRTALRGSEPILASLFHAYHARILAATGRFQQARHALERARQGITRSNDPWIRMEVHASAAEAGRWEGERSRVEAAARAGLGPDLAAPGTHPIRLELHATRLATDGPKADRRRRDGAARAASAAEQSAIEAVSMAIADAGDDLLEHGRSATLIAWCQAEIGRRHGKDDAAAWSHLAEEWQLMGRPFDAAYALYRLGESVASVAPGKAADTLVESHRICVSLGARPLAWRVERAGVPLGIDLAERSLIDGSDRTGPDRILVELTQREREVARLIARGASNREIAQELVITEKTASIHVSNIIGKLGVERRGEVAALMHQARQDGDAP